MEEEVFRNYLKDLGTLLREQALQAKAEKIKNPDQYNVGRLMTFHEIISLMYSQCEAFGIPLSALGWANIDPDKEYL